MNVARLSRSAILLLVLCLWLAVSRNAKAQEPEDGATITWWVVSAGGILNTSTNAGDTLRATLAQTTVDVTTVVDLTYGNATTRDPRPLLTANLGFWLPNEETLVEGFTPPSGRDMPYSLDITPNPFGETTVVSYWLPDQAQIVLTIFDERGNQVHLMSFGTQEPGMHRYLWDGMDDAGTRLSSGVYFCKLEAQAGFVSGPSTVSRAIYLIR